MTRGRWRFAAGLALIAVAGVIALSGGRGDSGPRLSDVARRFPAEARKVFVNQVRPGDAYVTAAARRVLCPDLPDSDPRPSPG